jgi:hypothetical protein
MREKEDESWKMIEVKVQIYTLNHCLVLNVWLNVTADPFPSLYLREEKKSFKQEAKHSETRNIYHAIVDHNTANSPDALQVSDWLVVYSHSHLLSPQYSEEKQMQTRREREWERTWDLSCSTVKKKEKGKDHKFETIILPLSLRTFHKNCRFLTKHYKLLR